MGNNQLSAAKKAKNDEFYTRMPDIENELRHYADHFKGKVVLCNCDDPYESNFFKYFALNFNHLGLRKLIATSYCGSPVAGGEYQPSLFDDDMDADTGRHRHAYKAIVTHVEDTTGDGGVDMLDVKNLLGAPGNEVSKLHGDGEYGAGDFRSHECLDLLDEADVVVTNPPFSLFREYVATLMEHDKRFVVIGNQNAIGYKEIFPLLRNNELWLGYGKVKEFIVPSTDHPDRDNVAVGADGKAIAKFGNICWYTNFDIKKRHEDLLLYRRYKGHESDYPKYDNYDAIEVSKVADIPEDYYGMMGVPITFMDKYNPEQFEILGLTCTAETMSAPPRIGEDFIAAYRNAGGTGHLSANMYAVTLFKKGPGKPRIPYGRILIHRKEASNQ